MYVWNEGENVAKLKPVSLIFEGGGCRTDESDREADYDHCAFRPGEE